LLATTGVYESWLESCPLSYSSGNAPDKRDVLGTWLLSILAGHRRYAHITGLRGDGVSPQILGMSKIVSEDSLRRSLARMSAEQSQDWLRPQLLARVQAALNPPWILDIDTTMMSGGADWKINKHFSLRLIQADWVYHHFGSSAILSNSVSSSDNAKIATGAVVRF